MKIFDNAEPGIDLNSASFFQVGKTKVRLAGSLLAIGAGTIRSDRLVSACLGKWDGDGFFLSHASICKHDRDSALVRVRLPVVASGEQRYEIAGDESLVSVAIWQRGLKHTPAGYAHGRAAQFQGEVHALVVLQPGGKIDFFDTFQSPPRPSLARLAANRGKSLNNQKTTVNRFAYDGDNVTMQRLHYRLLQPCNLRRTG